MSKKMLIFYSFPFNFLWKSLMTLMTMTLMTGFLSFLYPMQLVTPSVVAIAVRMLMAICRIVFQVFAFIFLVFNVQCLMFTFWGLIGWARGLAP